MAKSKGPKRPTRDEFELEELGERLVEAQNEESRIMLQIWNDEPVQGVIVKMDPRTKLVHVNDGEHVAKVPFMDIMKVSNADS